MSFRQDEGGNSRNNYNLQHAIFPVGGPDKVFWSRVQVQLKKLVELILTYDEHQYSPKAQKTIPPILLLLLTLD